MEEERHHRELHTLGKGPNVNRRPRSQPNEGHDKTAHADGPTHADAGYACIQDLPEVALGLLDLKPG